MMNADEINARFKKSISKDPSTLTCIVTGKARPTNSQYLEDKGDKEKFIKHYICRDALTLLKKGMSVLEVREKLGVHGTVPIPSQPTIEVALELNGK
jgi:hypothetical protein